MTEQEDQRSDGQSPASSSAGMNPIAAIDAVAPTGWRMKLAKAAAQLIAGTEKGAIAYAQMRERLDTIEGRTVVSAALAKTVAEQAIADPELVERAKARFIGTAIQQQENIEAVINGATEHLPQLPAPQDPTEPASESDNSPSDQHSDADTDDERLVDENPLNADWAATFTGIAENASTIELRERLSKVLAGEITSPGTYSRATVRAIAELERSDLKAMEAVMPYVLDACLMRTRSEVSLPPIENLLELDEAALISEANSFLSHKTDISTVENDHFFYGGREWGLIVTVNVGHRLDFPVIPLTRTGIAVVDLLGRPDERAILRRIADELPAHIYSKILLGRKTSKFGIGAPMEQLFPKPTVNVITGLDF